jgi:cell division protein FtsL
LREFGASEMKDQFFEKANEAIDAGLFWRGNLAKAVRQKDFKGTLWGVSVLSFFLFLYVWQHMEVVKLGYDVQALRQQKQRLTNEYYYLKYKMNDMNSLARVETIAHDQLGMQTPTSDQVVILDDSFSILPKWFLFWEKTAAPSPKKTPGNQDQP